MNFAIGNKNKCLCEDAVVRTSTVTRSADTFSSVPARVVAFGKTVTGFLTSKDGQICFVADNWRKNADVIWRRLGWTKSKRMATLSGIDRENDEYYARIAKSMHDASHSNEKDTVGE